MTALASALHMGGVVRKNFATDYLVGLLYEVNASLSFRREYSVDLDSMVMGLAEYLVDRLDVRLVELMGSDWLCDDWNFTEAGQSLIWDQFCHEVGNVSALEQLSDFVDEFTESSEFSSGCGQLIVEYIGAPDYPIDDRHLNPERIHSLALVA